MKLSERNLAEGRGRNALVIAAALLLILLAVVAVRLTPREVKPNAGELAGAPSSEGAAQAYLVVTAAGSTYEPIPLAADGRFTISRDGCVNVIEVTADSIRMAESTCENQNCVLQGEVNLENRKSRVLQNMILCLPNDVALELYTLEELRELMPDWTGGGAE
ncbi:MAG: NusG domain II-containing protein [Clostridia bacterium]|nr:NusG domain II-containing protein [Clostridia bacterium]